jgi:hypothetical protein
MLTDRERESRAVSSADSSPRIRASPFPWARSSRDLWEDGSAVPGATAATPASHVLLDPEAKLTLAHLARWHTDRDK